MKNKKNSLHYHLFYKVVVIILLLLESNFLFAQKDPIKYNSISAGVGYLLDANSFYDQYHDNNIWGMGIWISYSRETLKKYLLEGYIEFGNTYLNEYQYTIIGDDIGAYSGTTNYFFQLGFGRKFNLIADKFYLKLSTGLDIIGSSSSFVETSYPKIVANKNFYQTYYMLSRGAEIGAFLGSNFSLKLSKYKYVGIRIEGVTGLSIGLYSFLFSPYLSLDF